MIFVKWAGRRGFPVSVSLPERAVSDSAPPGRRAHFPAFSKKKRPCAEWSCCEACRSTTCTARTAAGSADSPPATNCCTCCAGGGTPTGRDKLLASGWGHLPQWCGGDDPLPLFAAADRHEGANARLYCELEGALPAELDLEQGIELTRAVAEAVTANGLPYVLAIHEGRPPAPGKPRNRHWHLMYLERIEDGIARDPATWFRRANRRKPAAGGAPKDRSLRGHEWLSNTRRLYERLLNEALERAGCPERVTCESHRTRMARAEAEGDHDTAEYLLRHPPGLHVGPRACAIERGSSGRPGRTTDRGDRARAREAAAEVLRAELERVERELKDLDAEDRLAAEAAARDAGVDVAAIVDAVGFSDSDQAIALLAAAEKRRGEIHQEARAAGLGDDAIDRIRRTAEPDEPDLGWAAVVESNHRPPRAQEGRRNRGA